MLKYATKYGITATDIVFLKNYRGCSTYYYGQFKAQLLQLYHMCISNKIVELGDCNGKTTTTTITPTTYTASNLGREVSSAYFLELYLKLRMLEEETTFTEAQKYSLIKDTLDLYKSAGPRRAINNFERIINKPFDYRGSLTYNNTKHAPAVKKAAAEEEGLPVATVGSDGSDTSGGGY